MIYEGNPHLEYQISLLTTSLPNGVYRSVMKLFNDEDDELFKSLHDLEVYDKMGDDRF